MENWVTTLLHLHNTFQIDSRHSFQSRNNKNIETIQLKERFEQFSLALFTYNIYRNKGKLHSNVSLNQFHLISFVIFCCRSRYFEFVDPNCLWCPFDTQQRFYCDLLITIDGNKLPLPSKIHITYCVQSLMFHSIHNANGK